MSIYYENKKYNLYRAGTQFPMANLMQGGNSVPDDEPEEERELSSRCYIHMWVSHFYIYRITP